MYLSFIFFCFSLNSESKRLFCFPELYLTLQQIVQNIYKQIMQYFSLSQLGYRFHINKISSFVLSEIFLRSLKAWLAEPSPRNHDVNSCSPKIIQQEALDILEFEVLKLCATIITISSILRYFFKVHPFLQVETIIGVRGLLSTSSSLCLCCKRGIYRPSCKWLLKVNHNPPVQWIKPWQPLC